jgi:hypothetical protein
MIMLFIKVGTVIGDFCLQLPARVADAEAQLVCTVLDPGRMEVSLKPNVVPTSCLPSFFSCMKCAVISHLLNGR